MLTDSTTDRSSSAMCWTKLFPSKSSRALSVPMRLELPPTRINASIEFICGSSLNRHASIIDVPQLLLPRSVILSISTRHMIMLAANDPSDHSYFSCHFVDRTFGDSKYDITYF